MIQTVWFTNSLIYLLANIMWDFIHSIFSPHQYIPHGHCYLWQTPLVALHVISNALIAIAYLSIPAIIIYFIQKRRDVPFLGVFTLFGAFIVLCGIGHLLEIWTLWHSAYWLSGIEHAMTAFVSSITAIQMVTLLPKFLSLKTPAQLEAINRDLQQEIIERQRLEIERDRAYSELEFRVQERTDALEQSQQWLSRLIEQLPIGIVEWDLMGNITKWNPASENIFGYSQEEVLGRHFKLIVLEEHYTYADQVAATILNQEGGNFSISQNKTKTGEIIICEWHNNPLVAVDGTVLGAVSIVMNITERKRIETENHQAKANLQKERECLKTILDNLTDGIVACDENGHLMMFNQATKEFHGLPESPLPPDQWADYFDLYLADGKTPMQTQDIPLFRAFQGEIVHEVEMVIAPKQGKARSLLASGRAFFDEKGKKLGAVVAMHDVTERQQAESALQKALQETENQSRLLRTVLDSTQDWIFAKDQNFRYILVNRSYADAIGKPRETILGQDDLELGYSIEQVCGNPLKGIRGFRSDDQIALTGEIIHNSYDPATLADGVTRIFDTRKAPLYDADGNVFGMLGFSRDVTERHYAEEALRRSETELKKKAEELEQTLRELQWTQAKMIQSEKMSGLGHLVAGVAHEINNPINFIHGNITPAIEYANDLLHILECYQCHYPNPEPNLARKIQELDLDFVVEDLTKLLSSMKEGTNRIRQIVLSLRNFSRMDEAEIKPVAVHEGIDSTLMLLRKRLVLQSNNTEIKVVKEYNKLPLIECFAGQLNQVFMNILLNAIDALQEANPTEPCITIRTSIQDGNQVKVSISDNGIGISEKHQSQIFDPFFTTKDVGKGTGLGLTIAYQTIVEKHGGAITLNSALNQGTEFTITLPVTIAASTK